MFLKQQSEYAKALQDHIITDPILLSFKKGDIIKIINRKDDEWFEGKCNGKQGMVKLTFNFLVCLFNEIC